MADNLAFFIQYLPAISVPLIPLVIWLGNRWKPTKTEKIDEAKFLTEKFKQWADIQETENRELINKNSELIKANESLIETNKELRNTIRNLKDIINEMKIELGKLRTEVENLKSCKSRYFKALDWIKDVLGIGDRENFLDKLPNLDSKINNDLKKR